MPQHRPGRRTRRRTPHLAAGAAVLAAVAALAGTTGAAPHPDGPAAAAVPTALAATPVLRLTFDEQVSWRSGSVVLDGAGSARGTVVGRGTLTSVGGGSGRGVRYPCATCGRVVVEVPDDPALDPGTGDLEVAVDVRMTREESRRTMNVVQKGYSNETGGQYKLQVDYGRPSCVIRSSRGRVLVEATSTTADVADGAWHHVACVRTASHVSVLVDGVVRARRAAVAGVLANAAPLRIGGKNATSASNDQYRAELDEVTIRIGG
ncbi:LamG domain-containing protein [Nocardioides sp. IC4_145]|uniref:LamG-like jellyroll fold domain-containing protein n=1 Tax=Nocardioides sp. IC4_145 TaxID=2714037 RepID=UPI00140D6A9E|nr:LamG-like jellyroll fold domain-containing protein [Nocardioides sp. IC4_145]NHC22916.1 LamG domain-containing protein [Nocardioides sp. IC4_145]